MPIIKTSNSLAYVMLKGKFLLPAACIPYSRFLCISLSNVASGVSAWVQLCHASWKTLDKSLDLLMFQFSHL